MIDVKRKQCKRCRHWTRSMTMRHVGVCRFRDSYNPTGAVHYCDNGQFKVR